MSTVFARKQLLPELRAAKYLGISQRSLVRYRQAGIAPAHYEYPGRVMYDTTELDTWMDARKRQPKKHEENDTAP